MTVAISPGATFGGYRVESYVARGGMGIVYRAIDLSLQRPVALKLIAPELAEGERFRARFLMKPRLAASLDHPSVVPIFEAGELHMHAPRRRREKHEAPRLCNSAVTGGSLAARATSPRALRKRRCWKVRSLRTFGSSVLSGLDGRRRGALHCVHGVEPRRAPAGAPLGVSAG